MELAELSEPPQDDRLCDVPAGPDTANKGIVPSPEIIERDAMGRPIILDGCIRGSPAHVRNQMDLLYPDEANVKVWNIFRWSPWPYLTELFFGVRMKENIFLSLATGNGMICFLNID